MIDNIFVSFSTVQWKYSRTPVTRTLKGNEKRVFLGVAETIVC